MGRIKRGAQDGLSATPTVLLKEGDWLDVLDNDGVWNVARVLSALSPDEVEITYDGWSHDYNEVVSVNSHRVAPYHTFTWTVKCWVKYLNWPLWPSLITVRTPGTIAGIDNLAAENRLFVDFLDNPSFALRDRCWQKKSQIRPFEEDYDKKRAGSTGKSFERALGWVLQSDASLKMPRFAAGTLPVEYKFSPAKSVETVRKNMSDKLWFRNFTHNRMRHQMSHVYETVGCADDVNEDMLPTPSTKLASLSSIKNKLQVVMNEDKCPGGAKMDANSQKQNKELYRLESADSNEDSDVEDSQDISRLKRKRVQNERRSGNLSKTTKAEQRELRRCVLPFTSRNSKSTTQLDVVESRKNDSKGRTKMATKQSAPSTKDRIGRNVKAKLAKKKTVDFLADNGEASKAQRAAVYLEKRSAADNCAKWISKDDSEANIDHRVKTKSSTTSSLRSDMTAKRLLSNAKKRKAALKTGLHFEVEKRHERIERNGRSFSSIGSQDTCESISACTSKMESKQLNSDLSRHPSSVLAEMRQKGTKEGKSSDTMTRTSKHAKGPRYSHSSVIEIDSSDSKQAKSAFDAETTRGFTKTNERIEEADVNGSAVMQNWVAKIRSTLLNAAEHNTHDDDYTQEPRRRFCMMQANQEATETMKCSKKTAISVPRRFAEDSARQMPTRCTNSVIRIAPPPRLRRGTSSVQTSTALAAPSTSVFSSSNGFSMESWFKRKLMTEFMSGGT